MALHPPAFFSADAHGLVISNMYLMMTINIIALGIMLMEDIGIGLVLSNMYMRMTMNIIALIKHKTF